MNIKMNNRMNKTVNNSLKVFILSSACLMSVACKHSDDPAVTGTVAPSTSTPTAVIGDLSGLWTISETSSSATAGCSETDFYNLTVQQTGNTLLISDTSGNSVNGQINGSTLTWSGSFPEGSGTITINSLTATVANNCHQMTSNSSWTYNETGFSCSGTTTATGVRISGGNGFSCQ